MAIKEPQVSTLKTLRDCADRCLKNAHHHPHTSSEFRRWLEMAEKLAKAAQAMEPPAQPEYNDIGLRAALAASATWTA